MYNIPTLIKSQILFSSFRIDDILCLDVIQILTDTGDTDTLTIPKKLTKGEELVVIPRKEYEEFLRSKKPPEREIVVKRSKSFRVPKKYEKFYTKLDQRLTKALREVQAGKVHGPFHSVEELRKSLERWNYADIVAHSD